MNIVCSGHLVRYPLGGHTWHHLQYLVGFRRLGHTVTFFEDWGWPNSCWDPAANVMTGDPTYGLGYMRPLFEAHGLGDRWCYLAEDGTVYGRSREELADACRAADVYFNLSGINWIPETEACPRRVLIDTDPVFTQIGAHGLGGPFERYHRRFTYGENVHRPGCEMPTGDTTWLPTRQPVVLDFWEPKGAESTHAPLTSVGNWGGYGEHTFEGRVYGPRSRSFEPFVDVPRRAGVTLELALSGAPAEARARLAAGGWRLVDPLPVTRTPSMYQTYVRGSRGEFGVAKHGYVVTRSGWFSDRSAAYLALGRPVIAQDTGFSDVLPCGKGLLAFRTVDDAVSAIHELDRDYAAHCRAARAIAEEWFDARTVLTSLLERAA